MIALAAVFAGLALFITGMNAMSEGLKVAAGAKLRHILQRTTQRHVNGLLLGSLLGFLIQSSAGTVMLVGFISAGLLTLEQAIPVVLGINVGTTLSMMLISFRLGDFCWLAILAGLALRFLRPEGRIGASGSALFGFGIIFLGLTVMSDAIRPYRSEIAPFLAHIDGASLVGMLSGVAIATAVTAIIQSSGAVIGMVFAMISAGAMTRLEQAWPIIIGANIGTCATALLGSIGASQAARRSARSHLIFNLFSALVGMVAAPLVYRYLPVLHPSGDTLSVDQARQILIQQCALANALKMLITALMALPFTSLLARAATSLSRKQDSTFSVSLLNPDWLNDPNKALTAAHGELSRLCGLCRSSLRQQAQLYLGPDSRRLAALRADEEMLDTLKIAMHDYLANLLHMTLSRTQSEQLNALHGGIDHLERISDHTARLAELSYSQQRHASARFGPETLETFLDLNQTACTVLMKLEQILSTEITEKKTLQKELIAARERYLTMAKQERQKMAKDLSETRSTPQAMLYRNTYLSHLNRIVKHARSLASDIAASAPSYRNKKDDPL